MVTVYLGYSFLSICVSLKSFCKPIIYTAMNLKQLKALNRHGLLRQLGYTNVSIKKVMYIIYRLEDTEKYTEFKIHTGKKERQITTPTKSLKMLQKKLAQALQECYFEIENVRGNKTNKIFFNAHGFLSNRSIITNAYNHKNKRYVLNIDLKDFFPSINFGRVYGFFLKNKYFTLSKELSSFIAQIVCFKNKLPQGAPTSPIISNLITMNLDSSLNFLANKYKLTYTRYADDITFSTNLREFPKDIAYVDENQDWILGEVLINLIKRNYFEINNTKTRMQYKTSRQEVTGLIVNKKVNVKREYIRYTRTAIYNFLKNDNLHSFILDDKNKEKERIEFKKQEIKYIKGRTGFIHQVRKKLPNYNKTNDLSIKLYKDFFYINNCIHNERITILTEGKTDKIYINTAFSYFRKEYSNLNFNIVEHSKIFLEALALNGDVSLKIFIDGYKKQIKKYKINSFKNPVIVLLDRDNKKILKALELYDEKVVNNEPFRFLGNNLYVCCLPKTDNRINDETLDYFSIEYYFPQKILENRIKTKNGKVMQLHLLKNDKGAFVIEDKEGDLGKFAFANYIKKLKYKNDIDESVNQKNEQIFLEFKKIFDLIQNIDEDYKNKK